jgi:DNA-binding NtrC family response regulator
LLHQIRVFIAEDEPFIALTLASAIGEARGLILGPAGSIKEALSLLENDEPHVGVLDVHLSDGDITPVAARLASRAIPIIFHCGELPSHLKLRHPKAPVYFKLTPPAAIVAEIAMLFHRLGR